MCVGALSKLSDFLCKNGAKFYGLKPHTETKLKLTNVPWEVPEEFELGDDVVVPLRAGGKIMWTLTQM